MELKEWYAIVGIGNVRIRKVILIINVVWYDRPYAFLRHLIGNCDGNGQ